MLGLRWMKFIKWCLQKFACKKILMRIYIIEKQEILIKYQLWLNKNHDEVDGFSSKLKVKSYLDSIKDKNKDKEKLMFHF